MHPLDPLTITEIKLSTQILTTEFPGRTWDFNCIMLKEPPKYLVLKFLNDNSNFKMSEQLPRKSFLILFDRLSGDVYEGIVNLTSGNVEVLKKLKSGLQPMFTATDFAAEEIVKQDPQVIRRCAELGYKDMNLVSADAWSITFIGDEFDAKNRRILEFFMYGKQHENDNMYAHPLNFLPVVDILGKKVIRIDELPIQVNDNLSPGEKLKPLIPNATHNFGFKTLERNFFRKDIKPIKITSPDGPSFTVDGHQISWQKFNLQISFNQREGLVLHNITYKDSEKIRPLIYRASIVELLVPYGDPRPPFHRKSAFDVGACGFGLCTNSLQFDCDCVGSVQYFDGFLIQEDGEPKIIKNAICLHEEDTGLLFKHTDVRTGEIIVARSRRLVLSFIITLLNYDYGMSWYFNQDASIELEIKATGALSTNLFIGKPDDLPSIFGNLVSPGVTAQQHQHLFAVRLDTMFDGINNSISTVDVKPMSEPFGSKQNPYGQGIQVVHTPLRNTTEAKTNVCSETSRVWRISNESSINEITKRPVGWNLVTKNGPTLLAQPGSFIYERAEFAKHSMWVTRFDENQLFPAGFYINQQMGEGGIVDWTKEEKNIENEDIVLWHVFGINHVPRIEDFPIMPVETCGFLLKPNNFFLANPALDVPPPNCMNSNWETSTNKSKQ